MDDTRWTDVWASVTEDAPMEGLGPMLLFRLEVEGQSYSVRFPKRQLDDIKLGINLHKIIFEELIAMVGVKRMGVE